MGICVTSQMPDVAYACIRVSKCRRRGKLYVFHHKGEFGLTSDYTSFPVEDAHLVNGIEWIREYLARNTGGWYEVRFRSYVDVT